MNLWKCTFPREYLFVYFVLQNEQNIVMTFSKIQILLKKNNEGTKNRIIRMNSILIDGKWPKKAKNIWNENATSNMVFFYSVISTNPNVTEEDWKVHREGYRCDIQYRCVAISEIFNALVFSIGIERGVICQLMNRNSYIVKNSSWWFWRIDFFCVFFPSSWLIREICQFRFRCSLILQFSVYNLINLGKLINTFFLFFFFGNRILLKDKLNLFSWRFRDSVN